jgi:hypothetical protein
MTGGAKSARAVSGEDAVRELRVVLAQALAAQGKTRILDAIGELDAALKEPGKKPTTAEIHFMIGELASKQDPLTALSRYMFALEEPSLQDKAAQRALTVIDQGPEGELAVGRLAKADVERLVGMAKDGKGAPLSMLAARVVQLRGGEERALRILQGSGAQEQPPDPGVILQIALLLLDLHRLDDALELVEDRIDQEQFRTVAMRARLLKGNYDEVLALADRDHVSHDDEPETIALRALAIAGQGRWSVAANLLAGQPGYSIQAARVVIFLVGGLYDEAQAAATEFVLVAPSDPTALILDAQVKLEALDDHTSDESDVVDRPPGEQLHAARALLVAAVSRLNLPPERLWWFQVQSALRKGEGPFQFFMIELRDCFGYEITEEELNDIDLGTTSYVQDAVIYERMADVVREHGSAQEAAQAYARASTAWQHDNVRDGHRCHKCASAAFELEQNGTRAADLAFAVVYDSYRPQDLQSLSATIDDTAELALRWILRTTGSELADLARAVAWLRGRQFEVAVCDQVRLASRAVPWLVAAGALTPHDHGINAVLASTLRSTGHPGAALFFAERAMSAERNAFNVSTMILCLFDLADFDAVLDLLEDTTVENDTVWCAAMSLATRASSGDIDAVPEIDARVLEEAEWSRAYAAMVACMQKGLASNRNQIDTVLERLGEFAVDYNEILLAGLAGRPDLREVWLARSAESGNLTNAQLGMCRTVVAWFSDSDMQFDALAEGFLKVAPLLCDVEQFVNVDAPLLVAAKRGEDMPRSATVPEDTLAAARLRLRLEATSWRERLDEICDGLRCLVAITEATTTTDVAGTGEQALAAVTSPEFKRAISEVIKSATASALSRVVRNQIEWRVGKGTPDRVGVSMSLQAEYEAPMSQRIAVLVLADETEDVLLEHIAMSGPEDQAEAVNLIVEAATSVVLDPSEFWRLFESLHPEQASSGTEDLYRAVCNSLLSVLSALLGLGNDAPEHRSYFSFVLGTDFVPADTGSDWALFKDLVPAMKERVEKQTGYSMPGCFVRGDYMARDALWILTNGAVREAHRLPTRGWIVACDPEDALCRDPLTGDSVRVSDSSSRPAAAWSPLEFMMRWVERFVLEHTSDLVSVWDIGLLVDSEDPDFNRLLAQPQHLVEALDIVRTWVADGTSTDTSHVADALRQLARQQPPRVEPVR